MPDPRLDEVARAALAELCDRFPLGYTPALVWKPYRVTAGMAFYKKGTIALSDRVLREAEPVVETLVHEYAHLLAVHRGGIKAAGHGPVWRQAMRDLGQEPQVRHRYQVERNVARQRVTYQCLRCGRPILRHRRLPKGRRYVHADCGGDLRLIRVERVTAEAGVP